MFSRIILFLVLLLSFSKAIGQIEAKCIYGLSYTRFQDIASNGKGKFCFVGEKFTYYDSGSDKLDFKVIVAKRDPETNKYSKINSVTYNRWSKGTIYETSKDVNCRVSMFNDTSFVALYNRLNTVISMKSKTNKAAYSGWKSMPKCVGYSKSIKKCVGLLEFDNHYYRTKRNTDYNSVYAFHNNDENNGIIESQKKWMASDESRKTVDRAIDIVADDNSTFYIISKNGYHEIPRISSMDYYGFKKQVKSEEGKAGPFIDFQSFCNLGENYVPRSAKYSKSEKSIYYITSNEKSATYHLQVINVNNGEIEGYGDNFPGPEFKIELTQNGLNSKFEFAEKWGKSFYLEIYKDHLYLLSKHRINGQEKTYIHKLDLNGKIVDEKELKLVAGEKITAKCYEITKDRPDEIYIKNFINIDEGHFAFVGYNYGGAGLNSSYGMVYTFAYE